VQISTQNAAAGRQGWLGPEMARDPRWLVHFTPSDLKEIDTALSTFKARGKAVADMVRDDFPLLHLDGKLKGHLDELRNGRGFVVLRGLPVEAYSNDDVGAMFFGLGLYMGRPLRQNPKGEVLGHVYDQGRAFGKMDVRGSQTNAFLPFHSDSSEIVGLLCLRPAKSGGLSSVSSSVSVYREIERAHPELVAPLAEGYHYIRREIAMSDTPVTEWPVPVFGVSDGAISCRLVSTQIEGAAKRMNRPIEGLKRTALDTLGALTADARFRLDMDLLKGDIQLVNNYVVLHSRTEYEDFAEPDRQRHMLRLWLAFEEKWPLAKGFARRLGYENERVVETYE
jgi:hypothetical protein